MESFDIRYKAEDGILWTDGRRIMVRIYEDTLVDSEILSVGMVGTERIKLVWDEEPGRRYRIVLKVVSAPARAVYDRICSPGTMAGYAMPKSGA